MKTKTRDAAVRPARGRSRFGYDHRFWGEQAAVGAEPPASYWSITRRPLPSLAFVAPLLLVYELGVTLASPSGAARTGADAWVRRLLASAGLTDQWLLPLGLATGLLVWHIVRHKRWKFPPYTLAGMAVESVVLAVALVGLSRVVDLGFNVLEKTGPPSLASGNAAAVLVGFLGAGVYEETLFRLMLIPLIFGVLRLLQTPQVLASTAAITTSALLFSLAHHAGTPGEAFTWFAFIFRWLAGVYFAWVFVVRGFGVAVGTHTAYDILVGWIGWHF